MSLEKICNLYASDFHFCTMLIPFINKNIKQGKEVINIFENDLEKNVKTIIDRTKLEDEIKKNLLKIQWNKKDININFEKALKDFTNEKKKIIFINGDKKYIDTMDENIEKWINRNRIEEKNIKIIHCYNMEKIESNIDNIISLYPKILNTTGEHKIQEVYSYI